MYIKPYMSPILQSYNSHTNRLYMKIPTQLVPSLVTREKTLKYATTTGMNVHAIRKSIAPFPYM